MITGFAVKHYKAFAEAEVALRPMTILLGPNNSGKTSLIQILLAFQQTALAADNGIGGPLKLNGRMVSLGSARNLFHKGEVEKPLTITFSLDSDRLNESIKHLRNSFVRRLYLALREYLALADSDVDSKQQSEFDLYLRDLLSSPKYLTKADVLPELVHSFVQLRDTERKYKSSAATSRSFAAFLLADEDWPLQSNAKLGLPDLELTSELLEGLDACAGTKRDISVSFSFDSQSEQLALTGICLRAEDRTIVEIQWHHPQASRRSNNGAKKEADTTDDSAIQEVRSDFITSKGQLRNYYKPLDRSIDKNRNLFSAFSDPKKARHQVSLTITKILHDALDVLAADLQTTRLSHVSPIRAYPRRFYLAEHGGSGVFDGEPIIELLKDRPELKDKVNAWLNKFGIEVLVEDLREILHRIRIKQRYTNVDLDITDVGFGVSQVLPVVINALVNPRAGLAAIEQPEIHLHPKMQAELASFYCDVLAELQSSHEKQSGRFLIETHSMSFMRRLRTMLKSDKRGLGPDEVAIYNVVRAEGGCTYVERTEITDDGRFDWPQSFLEAELEETLGYLDQL